MKIFQIGFAGIWIHCYSSLGKTCPTNERDHLPRHPEARWCKAEKIMENHLQMNHLEMFGVFGHLRKPSFNVGHPKKWVWKLMFLLDIASLESHFHLCPGKVSSNYLVNWTWKFPEIGITPNHPV